MKKLLFSLLCLIMIAPGALANDTNTQTNTSGSNTNITGGYTTTNNNTYQSGSSNDTTNNTTNTTTNTTNGHDTRVAGMASAPSMSAYSQDLCVVGISGGVSTIGLSISGGTYVTDENCERIKLSKTLSDLGMKVAAVSILCQDERVFFAMEQSGTPCPFEGKIGKAASEHWKKYDKLRPDFAQYTERLNVIQNIKETEKKEKELAIWKSKLESKKDVSEEDKKELDKLQEEIKALEAEIDYDKKKVQDKTLNQK